MGDEPPGQSITEALHTTTLLIHIYMGGEPPWSIEHRGLAYHYIAYIYIYQEMNPLVNQLQRPCIPLHC